MIFTGFTGRLRHNSPKDRPVLFALAGLDQVQADIQRLGRPSMLALWHSIRGQALLGLGRHADAVPALQAASTHFEQVPDALMREERDATTRALQRASQ